MLALASPVWAQEEVVTSGATQAVSDANIDITISALRDALRGVSGKTLTDIINALNSLSVSITGTPTVSVTNLDVALSTRTKPADQQHAIIDSGSVSAAVTGSVTVNTISNYAAETGGNLATVAGAVSANKMAVSNSNLDTNLDAKVSTLATSANQATMITGIAGLNTSQTQENVYWAQFLAAQPIPAAMLLPCNALRTVNCRK